MTEITADEAAAADRALAAASAVAEADARVADAHRRLAAAIDDARRARARASDARAEFHAHRHTAPRPTCPRCDDRLVRNELDAAGRWAATCSPCHADALRTA